MSEKIIRLQREGAISTLTIHRPEKRNAITNEMMEEIEKVARAFARDEQTRAIIIRAEGKPGEGATVTLYFPCAFDDGKLP